MGKIYIEVPTNANEVMVGIPYRNDELLGKIHLIFTELKESKVRIVTVRTNDTDDESKWMIQSQMVTNKNMRTVKFEYNFGDDEETIIHVSMQIMFSKTIRCVIVDW